MNSKNNRKEREEGDRGKEGERERDRAVVTSCISKTNLGGDSLGSFLYAHTVDTSRAACRKNLYRSQTWDRLVAQARQSVYPRLTYPWHQVSGSWQ